MFGKLVFAFMVVLAALVAVSAQRREFPVNGSTSCQFEYPIQECFDCCQKLKFGSGILLPEVVATADDGTELKGTQCVCAGSSELDAANLAQRQAEYFFERTTAPLNG